DLETSEVRASSVQTGDASHAVAAMLDELDPARPRSAPPPPDDDGGLFDQPAFFIAAGVVILVGAGTGAYLLLRDRGHEVIVSGRCSRYADVASGRRGWLVGVRVGPADAELHADVHAPAPLRGRAANRPRLLVAPRDERRVVEQRDVRRCIGAVERVA